MTPVLFLLVICAYPYLNFVIELYENFLDKKLFLHDYGIHNNSDEFEARPGPTMGMHDNSDEFEIRPEPTAGMHDYSDEFEIRPGPTIGMYDYSDEYEIRPDPTKGMHLKLTEPFKDKEFALI